MGLQVLELMQYTSVTTAPGDTGVVILPEWCDMILFLHELYWKLFNVGSLEQIFF